MYFHCFFLDFKDERACYTFNNMYYNMIKYPCIAIMLTTQLLLYTV